PYLLAFLITLALLVQLLTFDKLVPLLNAYNLPGGEVTTKIIVSLIVLAELFSLPFLLRMTLSPLARLCSALLSLMAITLWALLGLWAFAGNGPVDNSGLLSSVVPFGWGVTAVILLVALALTLWSFSILNITAIYRQAPI
ncbi:hypothetical protein CYG49_01285, partial [Candidatus Saccharibacteria bacterium]